MLVLKNKLPKILNKLDLVALYFALIFGSYGAAQLAAGGWVAIPMIAMAALTFLLPCILATYELGTVFPQEGGIYVWASKTAGPIHGFIGGWLSWVPIFLLLPLGANTIVSHLQFAFSLNLDLNQQVIGQCIVVIIVSIISLAKLRTSQNFIVLMSVVSFITALVVFIAGLSNTPVANPVDASIYDIDIFKHGALYSAAVLWLLGVEVPFNMGDEVKDVKRSARTMYLWGTLALLGAYFIGIIGILFITPQGNIDTVTGVAKAVGTHWEAAGLLVSVAIILAVSSQDVAYMNSFSRLLYVSGTEKKLPAIFGEVSKESNVPVVALLTQSIGAIAVILIFASQPSLSIAFNFYIGSLIVVWCTALFYIYYGVLIARFKFKNEYLKREKEIWKIPGGKFAIIFVVFWGVFFNALAIYNVFAYPMSSEVTIQQWQSWLGLLSFSVIIIGVIIYKIGDVLSKKS